MPCSASTPLLPSRRRVLQAGSLGLLGLSLPRLLAADAVAKDSRRREKSCIFIFQYGGLSQLDSWDPKPAAPEEMRGPYKPIATKVPGFFVGELIPRLAGLADKYAVIRSLSHGVPVHDVANKMLLAGRSQPPSDAPSLGAIVTHLQPSATSLPSHVWLQKFGGGSMPPEHTYLTGGFLGMGCAPLLVGTSRRSSGFARLPRQSARHGPGRADRAARPATATAFANATGRWPTGRAGPLPNHEPHGGAGV
jgi:hypothetical protein